MILPKKPNKKNHQNSDRDALPEKMAYLLKQTSIDFVNVIQSSYPKIKKKTYNLLWKA